VNPTTVLSSGVHTTPRKWAWLAYSGPPLLVWAYYLWVFWPGIIPSDTVDQWSQMVSGSYVDGHPVAHTLTMWLITRIYPAPPTMAIAQILAISTLIGCTLAYMRRIGMPGWAAWLSSVVVALLPANAVTVVTVMKDTAYGWAFLLFTFLLLKVVLTDGAWLEHKHAWIALGIAASLTALWRHNGWPVAFGTLALLMLAFRPQWRRIALSAAVAVGAWAAVRGPLYRALHVAPTPAYLQLGPILHHLAAHLHDGTPLTADQKAFLASVHPMPDDRWPYDPCDLGRLLFDRKFNFAKLQSHKAGIWRIWWDLLCSRPSVNLKHLVDSSTLVWRVTRPPQTRYVFAFLSFNKQEVYRTDPGLVYVEPAKWKWSLHRVPRPVPACVAWATQDSVSWLLWRPALPMYLFLAACVIAAIRARSWRYLCLAFPVVIQSGIMFLVCPATDFRYQWPVFLCGFLFTPFLLLCICRREAHGGN